MLYSTVIPITFLFCWGAFFLTWITGAIYNFLKGPKIIRGRTNSWRWLLIGIIGILLVQLAINSPTNAMALWSQVALNATELQVIGAILLIAATLFTLWSRLVLGTMWSSAAAVKSNHQLRTDGPYRITRHPIYTGMLGMLAGTSLILAGAWPVLLISVVIFLSKISSEERLMTEQFGEQYLAYKNRVPQLVPGLHLKRRREVN